MIIYKSPQTDVKEYLYDEYTISLYNILTEDDFWKTQFKPLTFFNLLFAELEYFERNANNYVEIKKHFGKCRLKNEKRFFFFSALKESIENVYSPGVFVHEPIFIQSYEYIKKLQSESEDAIGWINDEIKDEVTNEFYFENVKAHLDTIPEISGKIKYLMLTVTRFKQQEKSWDSNTPFLKNCSLEIKMYKELLDLGESSILTNSNKFKLSEKKGAKIDLIRIANALHSLNYLCDNGGDYPTKKEFMKSFGDFVGIDLSNYHQDLTQAFNSGKVEPNIKVFEDMKAFTTSEILNKLK